MSYLAFIAKGIFLYIDLETEVSCKGYASMHFSAAALIILMNVVLLR